MTAIGGFAFYVVAEVVYHFYKMVAAFGAEYAAKQVGCGLVFGLAEYFDVFYFGLLAADGACNVYFGAGVGQAADDGIGDEEGGLELHGGGFAPIP